MSRDKYGDHTITLSEGNGTLTINGDVNITGSLSADEISSGGGGGGDINLDGDDLNITNGGDINITDGNIIVTNGNISVDGDVSADNFISDAFTFNFPRNVVSEIPVTVYGDAATITQGCDMDTGLTDGSLVLDTNSLTEQVAAGNIGFFHGHGSNLEWAYSIPINPFLKNGAEIEYVRVNGEVVTSGAGFGGAPANFEGKIYSLSQNGTGTTYTLEGTASSTGSLDTSGIFGRGTMIFNFNSDNIVIDNDSRIYYFRIKKLSSGVNTWAKINVFRAYVASRTTDLSQALNNIT